MAADDGRILPFSSERPAVEPAARDRDLRDAPVLHDLDGLGARLTGIVAPVRLAVIKDIPLSADLFDAAVRGARMVEAIFLLSAQKTHIAVGNDRSAEYKTAVGIFARRIAKLMIALRGIEEVIGIADLTDGRPFIERMA